MASACTPISIRRKAAASMLPEVDNTGTYTLSVVGDPITWYGGGMTYRMETRI